VCICVVVVVVSELCYSVFLWKQISEGAGFEPTLEAHSKGSVYSKQTVELCTCLIVFYAVILLVLCVKLITEYDCPLFFGARIERESISVNW